MSINAVDGYGSCDGCGADSVITLETEPDGEWTGGFHNAMTFCQQCAIKAEALLRGARKRGPNAGQWS